MLGFNPGLGRIPVELPDKRMAPLSGVRFELFGISVQTESDDFERRMFAQATHVRDDLTVISSYKLMVAEMDDHA